MPAGAEWTGVVDINAMMNADTGDMKAVNDIHRTRVFAQYNRDLAGGMAQDAALAKARQTHLALMQFENTMDRPPNSEARLSFSLCCSALNSVRV